MDKVTLIILPLAVLFIIAMVNLSGLGVAGTLGQTTIGGSPDSTIYYDSAGVAKCYANGTVIGEAGVILNGDGNLAQWGNETQWWGGYSVYYQLYWDESATQPVSYSDVGKGYPASGSINIYSSFGLIAMIIGIMALAGVVGLRIMGSGIAERSASTIIMGTAFIGLWTIFSAISFTIITSFALGSILYLALTACYCIGILMNM